MARRTIPLAERFWAKVDKNGPVVRAELGQCWIWTAGKTVGYGRMFVRTGTLRSSHRLSWEINNGPIPDGMRVCHRCDNPPCIRPEHLFLGTALDNTRDMIAKKRDRRRCKITDEQVDEIRALRSSGLGVVEIASRFGITHSYVSMLAAGQWRTKRRSA